MPYILLKCPRVSQFILPILLFSSCQLPSRDTYQGYVEGEFVYVASPIGGALQKLLVHRGDSVKAGDLLFSLDQEPENTALSEAQAREQQARAQLENLKKGKRPEEMRAIEEQIKSAEANFNFSALHFKRMEKMVKTNAISEEQADEARTAFIRAQAQLDELRAQFSLAKLGAREDEIQAAEAALKANEAVLAQAKWQLAQKSQNAAEDAIVFDTFFREQEWVPPSAPVVALLPPAHIKVRFFVPEAVVPQLQVGKKIKVRADGAPTSLSATINYIAPKVEYTPPVIYSEQARAKLVVMIEASFDSFESYKPSPGQPVDIKITS